MKKKTCEIISIIVGKCLFIKNITFSLLHRWGTMRYKCLDFSSSVFFFVQIAEVNIPSHEGFAKTYDQGQAPSFWENLFIMCYCSQFDEDDFYLELDDLDTC